MKCIEIIAAHLGSIGADGLVTEDCGCELGDLAPCMGGPGQCSPGWRGAPNPDYHGYGATWGMYPSREAAAQSLANAQEAP